MEKTGGTLTVRSCRVPPQRLPEDYHPMSDGGYVAVSVEDTGCGMDKDVMAHIFDAFFTTKEAGKGTGMGLSVVQNILVSHGGYIQAESTPDQGSRFTFYLPERRTG